MGPTLSSFQHCSIKPDINMVVLENFRNNISIYQSATGSVREMSIRNIFEKTHILKLLDGVGHVDNKPSINYIYIYFN